MQKYYSSIEQLKWTDDSENDTENQEKMIDWFLAGREKDFPTRPILAWRQRSIEEYNNSVWKKWRDRKILHEWGIAQQSPTSEGF